uniref:SH3 domain-containing protein n=1 Tax=Paramoeba aestuarina TaxID=180227 RepID=A0A7S4N7Z7_9EUKA|mmetsp:Transcript_12532/g.19180  ORF Transcript_12532/g.19180 Transcript_12532/m.19180 type:complete len:797 (+) Transcript_12532:45-2435(+)
MAAPIQKNASFGNMDAFDDLEAQLAGLSDLAKPQQQQNIQQHRAVPQIQYLNKAIQMFEQSLAQKDFAQCDRYRNACVAAVQNLKECQAQGVPPEIDAHIKQSFARLQALLPQFKELQQQQTLSVQQAPASPKNSPNSARRTKKKAPALERVNSHKSQSNSVGKMGAHSSFEKTQSSGHLLAPGGSSSFEEPRRKQLSKRAKRTGDVPDKKDLSFQSLDVTDLPKTGLDGGQPASGFRTPSGKRNQQQSSSSSSLRSESTEEEDDEDFEPPPNHPLFPEGDEEEEEEEEEEEVVKKAVKKKEKEEKSAGPCIFRALYWHKPPKDEWLAFDAGEIITRLPCEPNEEMLGWEKGVSGSTGKIGLFPVAYVEKIDPTKQGKQVGMTAPPVSVTNANPTTATKSVQMRRNPRKRRSNNPRGSMLKNDGGDLENRQNMGINADKRASMLISQEIFQQMDFSGKKTVDSKKGKEKKEEEAVPLCLKYNDPKHDFVTPAIKKPSGDKEKKKQKTEVDRIIERILHNDPNVYKVDFSDIKIPYSSLKRLFAAIGANKRMYCLKLANCGLMGSHCQLLEINLTKNLALRELDLSRNGFGIKEAKILETTVQKCFCLVKLHLFTQEDLQKKKELTSAVQNIEWYLQSNVGFLEFYQNRSTELRLCGRALSSTLGWERYKETTLLNASHNYLKSINPKIGGEMPHLTELNLSHNDISSLPYSFGQLTSLTSLNLSFNALKELPSSLDRCTKLEVMHLENNKMRHFPSGVFKIGSLKEVYAANNKAKIPKDMGPEETIKFILSKYCKY